MKRAVKNRMSVKIKKKKKCGMQVGNESCYGCKLMRRMHVIKADPSGGQTLHFY
jgi:hypothetical protein